MPSVNIAPLHRLATGLWALTLALLSLPDAVSADGAAPTGDRPVGVSLFADPAFNGGNWFFDRFAGSSQNHFIGRRAAALPNGDVVIAGRVSWAGQSNPDGAMHLGLVRYNSNGARVAWPATSSPYFHNNRQYVIYPKDDPSIPATRYAEVVDLVHRSGYLYVMVDSRYAPPNHAVFIVIFNTNGSYVGTHTAFGDFDQNPRGAALLHLPGHFSPDHLIALGTRTLNGLRTQSMMRFAFNANGTLVLDAMPGASGGIKNIPVAQPPLCLHTEPPVPFRCDMEATAAATSGIFGGIYIGGQIRRLGNVANTWDYIVTKIDRDGNVDSDFGWNGQVSVPVRSGMDRLVKIVPRPTDLLSDDLLLVGNMHWNGPDWMATIAKVRSGNGLWPALRDPAFGEDGLLFIKGICRNTESCVGASSATLSSGLLTVAGSAGDADDERGFLLRIHPDTGEVTYGVNCQLGDGRCGGASNFGSAQSGLRIADIVPLPGDRMIAAGTVTDTANGGRQVFATARLARPDNIFDHGFETSWLASEHHR